MICDIWLSYSILSTLCKITDPNQLSLSRSPSASVGGSCFLLHCVWRKRQHSKHNMGADDENECNQSTFGRMLNACAHTPAHIGVLWWFMCDREWFSLLFFSCVVHYVYASFWPVLTQFFPSFNSTCYFIFYRLGSSGFDHWPLYLVDNDFLLSSLVAFIWLSIIFGVFLLWLSLCFLIFNLIIWFVHFLWFYFYCLHFCGACARASGMFAFVFQHSVTFMGCNVPWIRMRHANNIEHEKKSQHRTNSNLITIQKERAGQASTDKSKCKWWTLVVCTSHGYLRT